MSYMDRIRPEGTPDVHLRVIGIWKDPRHNQGMDLPDPKNLVDPGWRKGDRDRIVRYLKSGTLRSREMGWSYCRIGCGVADQEMGTTDLSDGLWVWPEGLAHYVEAHEIRLPDEFIATMEENGFQVPETWGEEVLQYANIDIAF